MDGKMSTVSAHSGHLFIVSAPSGAGKSTLCSAMIHRYADIRYSISSTTRPPRAGEKEGLDYFFLGHSEFKRRIKQGYWAEWAEVHGHFYGTSSEFLDDKLKEGQDLLLDIDVQGTRQMLERYPDSVTIFIMPPSLAVLKTRLELRGTDAKEVIERRLIAAEAEMAQKDLYRHIIVNDELEEAIDRFSDIIASYRSNC